jgi:hypothetical protein
MVKKLTKKGNVYHTAPYTLEEQADLLRRANGGTVSYVRERRPPVEDRNR